MIWLMDVIHDDKFFNASMYYVFVCEYFIFYYLVKYVVYQNLKCIMNSDMHDLFHESFIYNLFIYFFCSFVSLSDYNTIAILIWVALFVCNWVYLSTHLIPTHNSNLNNHMQDHVIYSDKRIFLAYISVKDFICRRIKYSAKQNIIIKYSF